MQKVERSEYDEQCIIFEWAAMSIRRYPQLVDMTASLVGVNLSIGQAVKVNRMGVKKAWPDIFLAYPRNGKHGLFIELKRIGGKATPEQKERLGRFSSNGYAAKICYGSDDAIKTIKDYLC